jgi:hypothetical protein
MRSVSPSRINLNAGPVRNTPLRTYYELNEKCPDREVGLWRFRVQTNALWLPSYRCLLVAGKRGRGVAPGAQGRRKMFVGRGGIDGNRRPRPWFALYPKTLSGCRNHENIFVIGPCVILEWH